MLKKTRGLEFPDEILIMYLRVLDANQTLKTSIDNNVIFENFLCFFNLLINHE